MSEWRWLFAAAAVAYVIGILIQVLLAGAAVFEMTDFVSHAGLGWMLGSAPLLIIPLAILARSGSGTILLTIALALDAAIQPELALARKDAPLVAALHPLNAMLLFTLAVLIAVRAVALAREPHRSAAVAPPEAALPAPPGTAVPTPPVTD